MKKTIAELAAQDDWMAVFLKDHADSWNHDVVYFAQYNNGCVYIFSSTPKPKDGVWFGDNERHLMCYDSSDTASDCTTSVLSRPVTQPPRMTLQELVRSKELASDEIGLRYFAQDGDGDVFSYNKPPQVRDEEGHWECPIGSDGCEFHESFRMCSDPHRVYDSHNNSYVGETEYTTHELAVKYDLYKHITDDHPYLIQAKDGNWWKASERPRPATDPGHWYDMGVCAIIFQSEELGSDHVNTVLTVENFNAPPPSKEYEGENNWL